MTAGETNPSPEERSAYRSRLVIIGLAILLMASAVYVVGTSLQAEQQGATLTPGSGSDAPSIPVEAGVFARASQALAYLEVESLPQTASNPERRLATYRERRAYEGAPPIIPHAVVDEFSFGENSCLQCHASGGYSPQFAAYTPIVPHPELINCRQCHVAVQTDGLFGQSTFRGLTAPAINQEALVSAPPPIPHGSQMRENCLACHAGPAAPEEIRFDHPARINCRQCHVQIETGEEWTR